MNYNNIKVELDGNIQVITINRPDKMNALNIETIAEIKDAFVTAKGNNNVNSIILTGEGEKAFVAGADIAEFSNFSLEEAKKMAETGHSTFNFIEQMDKPVIAAINGFALGGGCELAMACHMRVASVNGKFGQPELNLGIIPGYGGTQRLVRYVGKSKATELLLTCDMISAEEAKSFGLVNYVTEPGELLNKCKEILKKIGRKSTSNVSQVLALTNTYYNKDEDGFTQEIDEFANCFATKDFKEGVSAFLEKRKPEFTGE